MISTLYNILFFLKFKSNEKIKKKFLQELKKVISSRSYFSKCSPRKHILNNTIAIFFLISLCIEQQGYMIKGT